MKPSLNGVRPFKRTSAFMVLPTKAFEKKTPWQPGNYRRNEKRHAQAGAWGQASFNRFRSLMVLLLLTAIFPLYAQPTIQWDKTLGASDFEYFTALQQTRDGGYILGGWSNSGSSGDKTEGSRGGSDYWVVKLDAAGNKVWDKTFGGDNYDNLSSLQQTSDGGYILGGFSASGISGDKTEAADYWDYWVVKLDAAGNKQWDKTIGGNGGDYLSALQQTSDGGYVLGGTSDSGISGDKTEPKRGGCDVEQGCHPDYWVVKLDADGNKVWDKTLGGTGLDGLNALQQTSDGGFILGGNSDSDFSGEKTEDHRGRWDYWVVKLDAMGNKVWDKTLGGNENEALYSLQQTKDGEYILGGWSGSGVGGDKTEANRGLSGSDYWVVKLDAAGNKQWDKTLGGKWGDNLFALQQTRDGGYILGGASDSPISGDKTQASKGSNDFWVVKLDPAGNKVWDSTFGGSLADNLYVLWQTRDGGYILGGTSNSPISGDKTEASKGSDDYWVVKLAPFQEAQQVVSFTLINTQSEQPIRTLHDGDTINLADLPTKKLSIRADTDPDTVGSVRFELSGKQTRIQLENEVPYALFGDVRGDYEKWFPAPGSYTLTAIPYSQPNSQGEAGTPLTIRFTVKPPQVVSFTLINTQSEQPIRPLHDGDEINLADLPTKKLNIRADTDPATVGSVRFELSGKQTRTQVENEVPYALFGDIRGDYEKWYPAPGSYTLTATPYTERDAKGEAGTPLTIHFTVVRKQAATIAARLEQEPQAARAELAPRPTLYPNPNTDGRLQVQLAGQVQGRVRYSLLSSVGRELAEGTVNLANAGNLLEFDFSRQLRSTGLYYLRIEEANGYQVFKIMRK
jgi:hypothetical protein